MEKIGDRPLPHSLDFEESCQKTIFEDLLVQEDNKLHVFLLKYAL